jgi:hypothetical protein
MTLGQYHALKLWHTRHSREHPIEKETWDAVLTLWMSGWVGGAVALILGAPLAEIACIALLFLPSTYVALRAKLHRTGRLRCDWIIALR